MDKVSAVSDPLAGLELPRLHAWRELAITGMLLMDLAWMVPWFHAIVGARSAVQPGSIFLVLGGTMVAAHVLVRLMNYLRLRLPIRRIILAVFFLLAVYIGLRSLLYPDPALRPVELISILWREFANLSNLIPLEFGMILGVIFVGWRGMSLAQDYIGPLRVIGSFRFGFLMFLLYILFFTLMNNSAPVLMWSLFLFASLFAIGAARISVLRLLRGGQRVSFDRGWFTGLLLAIGGTIGGAALIAEVTVGIAPVAVGIILRLILALFILIISPIILLMVLAIAWVLDRLRLEDIGLFDSLNEGLTRLGDLINSLAEVAGDYSWIFAALLDTWQRWGPFLRLAVCTSILLVVGGLIVNRVRIHAERRGDRMTDERQDLVSSKGLLAQLQANMLARLQGLAGRMMGRRRLFRGYLAAAQIRRIYASLMDLSADLAHPRLIAQTPLEYQKTLNSLYLGLEPEIDLITRAYIRVRYGEFPENRSELDEIQMAWQQVESLGKAMQGQQKKRLKAEKRFREK